MCCRSEGRPTHRAIEPIGDNLHVELKGLAMFHYTDCGLNNIFLTNGVVPHLSAYGEGYSIQDSKGLHKAIGRWLIETPIR